MFKGSGLVDSLLKTSPDKFGSREEATKRAQLFLEGGCIKSITKSRLFEDGTQLYFWRDEDLKMKSAEISNVHANASQVGIMTLESVDFKFLACLRHQRRFDGHVRARIDGFVTKKKVKYFLT